MDIQALFDALSASAADERSKYHLTPKAVFNIAEKLDASMPIQFSSGGSPSHPHSYRGYYSDLAFEKHSGETTVGEFVDQVKSSVGKTFEGYKGGHFLMTDTTPLWAASYGSTGEAIIDLVNINGVAILVTKDIG